MRQRTYLAHGAARRRLPREAEGVRSGTADLAGDQVKVGDQVVHPGAAGVLIHAHAPGADGASPGVAVHLGERPDLPDRDARDFTHSLGRVVGQEFLELGQRGVTTLVFEPVVGCRSVRRIESEAVLAPRPETDLTDVLDAALEDHVLINESLADLPVAHEQVEDAVGQGQIAPRDERHVHVRVVRGRGASRADIHDPHARILAFVGQDAGEQDRVHLGHVVAPEDEVVADLEVLVAPHGLVALELRHEAGDRGSHAQTGVRLDVVRLQSGPEPLRGRVPVEHRPLAGSVDGHRIRPGFVQCLLVLLGDQVERLVPRDALPSVAIT